MYKVQQQILITYRIQLSKNIFSIYQFNSIIKMHSLHRTAANRDFGFVPPFIRKWLMTRYSYIYHFFTSGWCTADRVYRQARRGGVRGHEAARGARQGRGAHQGQGGAGPRPRGLAVHRGSEGDIRLLPRPRPQQLLQLRPPHCHRADV